MKKIIVFAVICIFSSVNISVAADAKEEELMLPGGKWWRLPKIVSALKLTSEEQKKFDALFLQNRRKMIDLKGSIAKEKLEMEQLFEKADFNESACVNQFKKIQDARVSLTTEQFRFLLETRKLLGYDRYQKLKENYQQGRFDNLRKRRDLKKEFKKRSSD